MVFFDIRFVRDYRALPAPNLTLTLEEPSFLINYNDFLVGEKSQSDSELGSWCIPIYVIDFRYTLSSLA